VHAFSQAGYADGSYQLIVQTYPSPVPAGGCPFYDADLDWAHDWLVPASLLFWHPGNAECVMAPDGSPWAMTLRGLP
jgi:hypothetical protein